MFLGLDKVMTMDLSMDLERMPMGRTDQLATTVAKHLRPEPRLLHRVHRLVHQRHQIQDLLLHRPQICFTVSSAFHRIPYNYFLLLPPHH